MISEFGSRAPRPATACRSIGSRGAAGAIQAQRATERIRLAAVALALVIGVANGGLGATFARPSVSEMAIFSVAATSPLVRLEAG